ncbi:MAG: 50S ribosomal protein L25 [Anaerolineae bacterium]|nr:50S ribosomal protein L25 [Anaerolineae bacterium]
MDQIVLNAQTRTVMGKQVKQLRQEGWTPAVIYGPNVESRMIQIASREATSVVRNASSSQLIAIAIEGEKPVQVLIRGFQQGPIRKELLHVDLYQVDMAHELTAEVPLILVGVSRAVEQREGILTQLRNQVEISCLPGDLIDGIEVDLSELNEANTQITVSDLAFPAGITVLTDPDEILVMVNPLEEIREEAEEELFEFISETSAEPEVISRGKAEEDLD